MFDTSNYEDKVPSHLLEALVGWGKKETFVGGFLRAVLSNDLKGAIGRADSESLEAIKSIVMFIHWELPSACQGSVEKFIEWESTIRQGV